MDAITRAAAWLWEHIRPHVQIWIQILLIWGPAYLGAEFAKDSLSYQQAAIVTSVQGWSITALYISSSVHAIVLGLAGISAAIWPR